MQIDESQEIMKSLTHQERVKFWHAQDLGKLELLHARYLTHTFTRHTHKGYAIGVIEAGAETFYYRGQMHVAGAGSVVVINPGEVHTGQAFDKKGWSYRMFYPEIALVQKAAREISTRWSKIPNFPNPVIYDADMADMLRHLHRVLETSTSKVEREFHFISALAQLIARHAEGYHQLDDATAPHNGVHRAREYLETHFAENVSLEQLANIAHLSPYHFVRVFRGMMGLPPHTYLTQLRVDRAKNLLAQAKPIAGVAVETGFVDQSHLTRHFKRIVGVTPGQYLLNRKIVQDG